MIGFLHLGNGTPNWLDGDWPTVAMGHDLRLCAVLRPAPGLPAFERLDFRRFGASVTWRVVVLDVHEGDLSAVLPGPTAASVIVVLPSAATTTPTRISPAVRRNGDGRQPDRDLPAWDEPAADRRLARGRADGVPDGRSWRTTWSPSSACNGGRAIVVLSKRTPLRSAGDHHVAVRGVVAGAGADRRAHFVQLRQEPFHSLQSPSFRWYWEDPAPPCGATTRCTPRWPTRSSLRRCRMLIAVPLGIAMAIGLQRWRGRTSCAANT